MNHISFEDGIAMLATKPNLGLTRLCGRYHAHQWFAAQGHDDRSTAAMNLLKELDAARLEFRDEKFFHNLICKLPFRPSQVDLVLFARQFKTTTGLPPHQYVIARRVERAQQLLRGDGDLGLAEVALRVGFSDQSQFSFHFRRIVGVTPRQFRISARIA